MTDRALMDEATEAVVDDFLIACKSLDLHPAVSVDGDVLVVTLGKDEVQRLTGLLWAVP